VLQIIQEWRIELMEKLMHHKIIMLIFLVNLTTACSSIKIPASYYSESNKIGPDAFEITLNSDSTFLFVGWSDVLGENKINGKWTIKKDTLLLMQESQESNDFIKIIEKTNNELSGIRIKVLDENTNESLIGSEIYINNVETPYIIGLEDEIYIQNENIRNLIVKYLHIDKYMTITNTKANDFSILINFNKIKLEVFHLNDKWLIKRGKLIPLNEKNEKIKNQDFIRKLNKMP